MSPSGFIPNKDFPEELEREPKYKSGLAGEAEKAVTIAKAIARAEAYDEGDYHDSIRVTVDGRKVYVSAFDWKAWWIERGSVNNTPSAPLARSVRVVGMKFTAGT